MRTPSSRLTRNNRPSARLGAPARRALALALVPALALPLVACTGPDVPPADAAADDLLQALQSGSFDGLHVNQDAEGDPQAQTAEVLAPLLEATGAEHPDVSVTQVDTQTEGELKDKQATATLQWTWPLGAEAEWTYLTRAQLDFVEPEEGSDDPGFWATRWDPSILVPDLKPGERLEVQKVAPVRAEILDGAGEPLVTNRKVWRVGIDKTRIAPSDWDSAARALAQIATDGGIASDPDKYAARVQAAGAKAFVELVTVRQEDPKLDIEAVRLLGASALDGERALAPTSTFARPILGTAGEATKELIDKSEGRLKQGDITGLSGLQRQYDVQLTGSPGVLVTAAVPDSDIEPREVYKKEAVNGTPLATTFDVGLQERAESVLAGVTDTGSAIVAIRPSTGEVLAAAVGPGSENNNLALLGKYAPGSTFKVVDALAFGRKGITPDTTVPCTPTINVNGKEFKNVPGYPQSAIGDIPFRTAFAHSCNTAMISQHETVSQQDIVTAAQDLGLGVETPVGTPVFYGNVPVDATPAQHGATLIGQDRIEASPFTMARIAASIAAGKRVDPVLVRPQTPAEPKDVPTSAFTAAEGETIRTLMGGVVENGSAGMLQDVPGIVGAKTGTAQFGEDAAQQHTWMIAIAGDLAVAVFVESGELGSTTSGPLMHAFLTGQ